MTKSNLEKTIEQAVGEFALQIVKAIKTSTLQELVALQTGGAGVMPKRPGRKPKALLVEKQQEQKPERKKRIVKNYPKCAFPRCTHNRFVRGKGFCGEHWKQWLAGKIKDAEFYKKKSAK